MYVWSGGGALFVWQLNTKHPGPGWWRWWWHQKAVAVVWRLRALVYRIIMILITVISGGLGNTLSSQPNNYLRFLEGGTKLFVYHKNNSCPIHRGEWVTFGSLWGIQHSNTLK